MTKSMMSSSVAAKNGGLPVRRMKKTMPRLQTSAWAQTDNNEKGKPDIRYKERQTHTKKKSHRLEHFAVPRLVKRIVNLRAWEPVSGDMCKAEKKNSEAQVRNRDAE